ncbi:MAG: hypothetical protein IPL61_37245 [Myxococcales bacterium]|nr:hypothetical protein [Myxococcales bacterium]
MMRTLAAVAALFMLTASVDEARADAARWYGWQIIPADAAADAAIVAGRNHGGAVLAGVIVYIAGGPIVHMAHDEWNRAGLSLGARLLGPGLGALAGSATCTDGKGRGGCLYPTVVGLAIGALVAQIVDPAVLAYDDAGAAAVPLVRFGGSF